MVPCRFLVSSAKTPPGPMSAWSMFDPPRSRSCTTRQPSPISWATTLAVRSSPQLPIRYCSIQAGGEFHIMRKANSAPPLSMPA